MTRISKNENFHLRMTLGSRKKLEIERAAGS